MSDLRLDDCSHCACMTRLAGYSRESAIAAIEDGSLTCWNCGDQGDDSDGHERCVVLFDGDTVVRDFRCRRPR